MARHSIQILGWTPIHIKSFLCGILFTSILLLGVRQLPSTIVHHRVHVVPLVTNTQTTEHEYTPTTSNPDYNTEFHLDQIDIHTYPIGIKYPAAEFHLNPSRLQRDDGSYYTAYDTDWEIYGTTNLINIVKKTISNQQSCLMVDVGMNIGQYSNFAAANGCRVVAFEMQEACIDFMLQLMQKNQLMENITIYQNPVSDKSNIDIVLPYPAMEDNKLKLCSGLYGFSRTDCDWCVSKSVNTTKTYKTVALDDFFPLSTFIDFLKIDTEGHDPQVLAGAEQLFRHRRVRYVQLEASPKMWNPPFDPSYLTIWRRILSYGYKAGCLKENAKMYGIDDVEIILELIVHSGCAGVSDFFLVLSE